MKATREPTCGSLPEKGFWRVLYSCGRTIGHLTVGDFAVRGVPLFVFMILVSS